MPDSPIAEHRFAAPRSATARLLAIANSDTGRSRRLADFLLAWRNGSHLGHFPIEHLWNVDRAISADMMMTILNFLTEQPSAVYANAFDYEDEMRELVELWRAHGPAA